MNDTPCLTKTARARELLAAPRRTLPPTLRMLLISVDGRRTLASLYEVAHSLGLGHDALVRLHAEGLISAAPTPLPAAAPHPAPAPDDELHRLMRAKMFALDLVGRMLAGRDAELRDRARKVRSEPSFRAWLEDAATHVTAAAGEERGQFFRQRVAEVAG